MKTTLVICPMREELEELLGKIGSYQAAKAGPIDGFSFTAGQESYFAFVARIGKTNIGFDLGVMSSAFDIARIYNVGVAGSLKESLVPLNVVVASKTAYYDVDLTGGKPDSKYAYGQMAGESLYFPCDGKVIGEVDKLNTTLTVRVGTVISGDSFATRANMSEKILSRFDDPLAVDMESAAVGQMASRLKVPYTIIRGISDYVFSEVDNGEVFNEFLHISARRAASVFVHLINKEYVDPEFGD